MSTDPNDPLLEIFRIKESLAREAGYDTKKFFQQLDDWVNDNPIPADRIISVEELRQRKAKPKAAEVK